MNNLIDELGILKESTSIKIVEGKKDKLALESLKITNIRTLNKPLYKIAEECLSKEVIILTDLDRQGKRLYAILKRYLTEMGARVNDRFRNFLFKHSRLTQIQGISSYLRKNSLYPNY
jgi:5S rRNA maturation endonuclease (ribonuclease M5)